MWISRFMYSYKNNKYQENKENISEQEYFLVVRDDGKVHTGYYSRCVPKLYKKRWATAAVNVLNYGNTNNRWKLVPAFLITKEN